MPIKSKVRNFIKSKKTIRAISVKDAEQLIEEHHKSHNHFKEAESKNPKKTGFPGLIATFQKCVSPSTSINLPT